MDAYGKCGWYRLLDSFGELDGTEEPVDCSEPAVYDNVCDYGRTCANHKCRCAKLITPEYLDEKRKSITRSQLLVALTKAWRKEIEKQSYYPFMHFIRDLEDLNCQFNQDGMPGLTIDDSDECLLAALNDYLAGKITINGNCTYDNYPKANK